MPVAGGARVGVAGGMGVHAALHSRGEVVENERTEQGERQQQYHDTDSKKLWGGRRRRRSTVYNDHLVTE